MLLKVNKMNFKIIKSAKVSVKLTIVYAVMFSLVLLILNASVLYGIKYYLYSQANKQIEDVKIMVLNKAMSKTEQVDLSDKKLISDVPTKENISLRILQQDGKVLNISKEFNYSIKIRYFTTIIGKDKTYIFNFLIINEKKTNTINCICLFSVFES